MLVARRSYQDYSSYQSFFCQHHWQTIGRCPQLAPQVFTTHLHALKLFLPSEQTSADVAAGIAVAQYGPTAGSALPPAVLNGIYEEVKAQQQTQLV